MTSFSVIIPSYNQQDYLPDAIESALEQTLKPYEIIVVDDGSSDKSLEIARQYAASTEEPGDITVVSQRNKGLASARNTGIMHSWAGDSIPEGHYILPLDADDQLMPNCLERMVAVIEKTNADIVSPSFKHFGTINEPLFLQAPPTLEDFKTGNRLPYFSAIRREALLECGGYSPRMQWGYEDYHLWFDLLSRGKTIAVIPEILVLYRTKEHSMIHEANKHSAELMQQIIKDFPNVFI